MIAILLLLIGISSSPVFGFRTTPSANEMKLAETLLSDTATDGGIAVAAAVMRNAERGQAGLDYLRKALRQRLLTPKGDNPRAIGEGYRYLFWYAIAEDGSLDELLVLYKGLVTYERNNPAETFADGSLALSGKTGNLTIPESAIRKGLREISLGVHDSARLHTALGRIQTKQGNLDAALASFRAAKNGLESYGEMVDAFWWDPKSLDLLLYEGDLYSLMGETDKAVNLWKQGLSILVRAEQIIDEANPFVKRIREKNLESGRDLVSLDEFLRTSAPEFRKRVILESVVTEDIQCPRFSLLSLSGSSFNFVDVLGKIVVINSWAPFCSPCYRELPDLERLAEAYKDDDDVVFLTIASYRDRENLSRWVLIHELELPVLIDDFSEDLSVLRGLPRTTFIDRQGFIRFDVVGSRKALVEEFAWRIDALKNQE